jgi:hypothetical protein
MKIFSIWTGLAALAWLADVNAVNAARPTTYERANSWATLQSGRLDPLSAEPAPPNAGDTLPLEPLRQAKAKVSVVKHTVKKVGDEIQVVTEPVCTLMVAAPVFDLREGFPANRYISWPEGECTSSVNGETTVIRLSSVLILERNHDHQDFKRFRVSLWVFPGGLAPGTPLQSPIRASALTEDLGLRKLIFQLEPEDSKCQAIEGGARCVWDTQVQFTADLVVEDDA